MHVTQRRILRAEGYEHEGGAERRRKEQEKRLKSKEWAVWGRSKEYIL